MDVQLAPAESERKVSVSPHFDIPDLRSISKHVQNDLANSCVHIGVNRFVLDLGACIISEIALISRHHLRPLLDPGKMVPKADEEIEVDQKRMRLP
jgi:hypothetical protein